MKTLTRIVVAVLSVACIAFLAIVMIDPQLGEELQTKLEDIYHHRSEVIEASPVRSLEIAYDFPLADEGAFDYWVDPAAPDVVLTWFRDLDRDLWLPFMLNQEDHYTVGKAFLVTRDGIFRQLEPGEFEGDSNVGEAVIFASALRDVPEGDYWVVLQVTPDEIREPYHMPWYVLNYVGIYDACTFHTEDYRVVTGGIGGGILMDRSKGEGFPFHLANLGDNIVTDVWKLEFVPNGGFTRANLKEGKDFILSDSGATVTLTPEYLNSLAPLYQYPFLFGLGDHSEVYTAGEEAASDVGVTLVLSDGPLVDAPYMTGPETYSLASGEDCVLRIYTGRAEGIWEIVAYPNDGSEPIRLDLNDVQADGTLVIPAGMMREMAGRGADCVYLETLFEVTNYGMAGYYRNSGFNVFFET